MFGQPFIFALKGILHVKYEKNLLIMLVSLIIFHNIGLNLAQILSEDHTHFEFFILVSNEIC